MYSGRTGVMKIKFEVLREIVVPWFFVVIFLIRNILNLGTFIIVVEPQFTGDSSVCNILFRNSSLSLNSRHFIRLVLLILEQIVPQIELCPWIKVPKIEAWHLVVIFMLHFFAIWCSQVYLTLCILSSIFIHMGTQ